MILCIEKHLYMKNNYSDILTMPAFINSVINIKHARVLNLYYNVSVRFVVAYPEAIAVLFHIATK